MIDWNTVDWNRLFEDDNYYETIWTQLTPQDFYYCVIDNEEPISSPDYEENILITPKAYLHKFGDWFDQHLSIDNLLPEYMEEVCEATYTFDGVSKDQVKSDLESRGFEYKD